jgi:hypothetical protein
MKSPSDLVHAGYVLAPRELASRFPNPHGLEEELDVRSLFNNPAPQESFGEDLAILPSVG